jgi:hypothetical protein
MSIGTCQLLTLIFNFRVIDQTTGNGPGPLDRNTGSLSMFFTSGQNNFGAITILPGSVVTHLRVMEVLLTLG